MAEQDSDINIAFLLSKRFCKKSLQLLTSKWYINSIHISGLTMAEREIVNIAVGAGWVLLLLI